MKRSLIVPLVLMLAFALITNSYVINFITDTFRNAGSSDDFFEQLSKKYYGTDNFSNGLAIVNQAILLETGYPDESMMIIPTKRALITLYNNYDMVNGQVVAKRVMEEVALRQGTKDSRYPQLESKVLSPIQGLILMGALILGFLIGKKSNHSIKHITDTSFYPAKQTGVLIN